MISTIYVPKLTPDLQAAIKDSLLSIHFRKKDLISFLKSCGFTNSDLLKINEEQTKSDIVDQLFDNLSQRSDKGAVQIKTTIDTLLKWSNYGTYWFRNGSLDKKIAEESIENLKRVLGEKTKQDEVLRKRKEREFAIKELKKRGRKLDDIHKRFLDLCKMQEFSQKRGYELEKLIVEICEYNNLETETAFKLEGEQIDGAFNFLGQNYIFEAKWQDKNAASDSLYAFAYKIDSNTLYPRGIFLSINGYSEEAINRITHNKKPQLILLDSLDLIYVLEDRITFTELLKKKIKFAQTRGEIYVNVSKLLYE